MAKKYLIANWKMSPSSLSKAKDLFSFFRKKLKNKKSLEIVFAPPFVYLSDLLKLNSAKNFIKYGAQDVFWEEEGSFTGEISIKELKDLGVKYVIVGHSERRSLGETNSDVNKKIKVVLHNKIIPVVCIGEKERDGHGDYLAFVRKQISGALEGVKLEDLKNIIFAYEPVWAIGKSDEESIKPHDLEQMIIYIRKVLMEIYNDSSVMRAKIIYGGSVEKGNSRTLLEETSINGFLIGHASLDKEEFFEIYKSF